MSVYKTSPIISKTINAITKKWRPPLQGSEIGRFRGDHPVWLLIPLAKDQRQEMDCMQREITAKKGGKLQNVNPIFFHFQKDS